MVTRKKLFAAFLILLLASFSLLLLHRTAHKQQHLRILAGSPVDQHWQRIQAIKDGLEVLYSRLNKLKAQVGSGKTPWNRWSEVQAIYADLAGLDEKLATQRSLRSKDSRLWLSQKLKLWGAENGVGLSLMNFRTNINCWVTFHPRGPPPAPAPPPAKAPTGPSKVTQSQTQGDDAAQAEIVKELDALNAGTTSTAPSPNAGDLKGAEVSLNGNPDK